MAGQTRLRGSPLGAFSYVGVAPVDVEELEPGADAEVILTVENFASFNRQVAEAMTGREIVVYTAGFPSRATVRALRRLRRPNGVPVLHWGDIDAGGIRSADHLTREVAPGLSLHLMTSALACERGVPAAVDASISDAGENAEIAVLARFLAEPGAAHPCPSNALLGGAAMDRRQSFFCRATLKTGKHHRHPASADFAPSQEIAAATSN